MTTDYETHRQLAIDALNIAADSEGGSDLESYELARAQVHATLALAAATAPEYRVEARIDRPELRGMRVYGDNFVYSLIQDRLDGFDGDVSARVTARPDSNALLVEVRTAESPDRAPERFRVTVQPIGDAPSDSVLPGEEGY